VSGSCPRETRDIVSVASRFAIPSSQRSVAIDALIFSPCLNPDGRAFVCIPMRLWSSDIYDCWRFQTSYALGATWRAVLFIPLDRRVCSQACSLQGVGGHECMSFTNGQHPDISRQVPVYVESTAHSWRTTTRTSHVQHSRTVYVWAWCTSPSPRDDTVDAFEGERSRSDLLRDAPA